MYMKLLFGLGLLLNVILFVWEWHTGALQPSETQRDYSNQDRQIWLVSEIPSQSMLQAAATESNTPFAIAEAADLTTDQATFKSQPQIEETPVIANTEQSEPVESSLSDTTDQQVLANAPDLDLKPVDNDLASVQATRCFRVGPFVDQTAIATWAGDRYPDLSVLEQSNDVIYRYLVYLDTHELSDSSEVILQKLKDKGVKDYWLFREGELKGLISLGLFQAKTRADALQKRLNRRGVETRIMPRYKQEIQYFAKIQTSSRPKLDEPLQIIDCPQQESSDTNLSVLDANLDSKGFNDSQNNNPN